MSRSKSKAVNSLVVVSDLHCGCQFGLCPPEVTMDGGGKYKASKMQGVTWAWWQEFINDFIPAATRGEPFDLCVNGDALDGVHHGSTTQLTHNHNDQRIVAEQCLRPLVEKASRYFHIRGTEAHVGQSGENEETLARSLGAVPDDNGNHARWEMRYRLNDRLLHLTHHISTTSSPYSETTALLRELVNGYVESGRWQDDPIHYFIRSHRHTCAKVEIPSAHGWIGAVTTPGNQLKTPFVFKIGARVSQPQMGGLVLRVADGELFVRAFVKRISPPREVR